MPQRVVDGLEFIKIKHHHGDCATIPPKALTRFFKLRIEFCAVSKSRQYVMPRHARHAHKGSHADQWRRLLSRPAARGRNATAGRRDRTSFQFAGRQLKAMPRFDYN